MAAHGDDPGRPVAVRVGDAERQAAATLLQDHFAEGRLTWSELDERLGAAYAARTRGELDTLFHDLPSAPPVVVLDKPQPPAAFRQQMNSRLLIFAGCFVAVVVAAMIAVGSFRPAFALVPLLFFLHTRGALVRRGTHPRVSGPSHPRLGNPYAPGGARHSEVARLSERHRHSRPGSGD